MCCMLRATWLSAIQARLISALLEPDKFSRDLYGPLISPHSTSTIQATESVRICSHSSVRHATVQVASWLYVDVTIIQLWIHTTTSERFWFWTESCYEWLVKSPRERYQKRRTCLRQRPPTMRRDGESISAVTTPPIFVFAGTSTKAFAVTVAKSSPFARTVHATCCFSHAAIAIIFYFSSSPYTSLLFESYTCVIFL